jgi:hypothetical protein
MKGQVGKDYKSSVVFEVDGHRHVFALKFMPTFMPVIPCLEGPHKVHSQQLPDLSNVWDVADLQKPQSQKLTPH